MRDLEEHKEEHKEEHNVKKREEIRSDGHELWRGQRSTGGHNVKKRGESERTDLSIQWQERRKFKGDSNATPHWVMISQSKQVASREQGTC